MQTHNFVRIAAVIFLISVQCTKGDVFQSVAGVFENVIEFGKQAIVGYPLEFVSNGANLLCTAALAVPMLVPRTTINIDELRFDLMKPCQNHSFTLTEPSKMWQSEHFDPTKKVVIFATGYSNTINDTFPMSYVVKPYLCRDDVNFIVLDAAKYISSRYYTASLNTQEVGRYVAIGLENLIETVPVENIHLMGHSLGAHIMSAAGRYFTEFTKKTIPRITALDPAKICFKEGESITGLQSGDADFVDVIHSNPGVLGMRDPVGDIDFYPGGLAPIAPGTLSFVDSHGRSVEYYGESAYPGNENLYIGVRCSSMDDLRDEKCNGEKVPLGYATPNTAKGIYFLEVNSASPYGQGIPKEEAINNQKCGSCE